MLVTKFWLNCHILLVCTDGTTFSDGHGPERRYACWGSFGPPVVSAQCPRDTVLHVLRAGLKVQSRGGGAECTYNDADCGCILGELGCNMPNVRAMCMGRPACRLDVTQQYINTDSCRGFSDYMYIEYNCVPGRSWILKCINRVHWKQATLWSLMVPQVTVMITCGSGDNKSWPYDDSVFSGTSQKLCTNFMLSCVEIRY